MSSAEQWIRERLSGAPADLMALMSEAIAPFDSFPVPEALARAASSLYGTVVNGGGGREDALPLLAADALLTHAFEAQAEVAPSRLSAFAREWTAIQLVKS